ncbi:hypothetical protein ACE2AJ_07600 [Aquihabitans daechungensis]|uniref:hypothetical protein n=1 Tax=Aquihabitans daechungensis TaxID=1052257 RepID=UPI003BA264B2
MRANAPAVRDGGLVIDVDGPDGSSALTFRLPPGIEAGCRADASLAATLFPAMRNGQDLTIEGPVSPRLLAGVDAIQAVFCTWDRALRLRHPWYRRVDVRSTQPPPSSSARTDERGTAAFFTGGVDSFHTAIVHRRALDALVYVHGFDIPLDDRLLRAEVSTRLGAAAADLGLPLLEVEADLQAFGDRSGVGWPDYHGAALATIAHLLASRFSRVLIPATHTYAHLEGLGSHPLLDPLWSTDEVEIEHVGADATRIDKVRAIASEPAARAHLRVCWENRGGAYNCGRCEKCIRTGVAIRIAGAEGAFPGVPPPSLVDVARARPTGRGSAWTDLHDELVRLGTNPRLQRAVEVACARHQAGRLVPLRRRRST